MADDSTEQLGPESWLTNLLGEARARSSPPPPPEQRIRYPLPRSDIAEVWFEGRWQWAVIRPAARGRPRTSGLCGRWIETGIFVPSGKNVGGIGLGGPPPRPNTVEDAIQAATELADLPKRKPTARLPFWFIWRKSGPGRPLLWTDAVGRELVRAVQEREFAGATFEAAVRSVARSKTFGKLSHLTLRRRYFEAVRKCQPVATIDE